MVMSNSRRWFCVLLALAFQPQTAEPQRVEAVGECGAEICLQAGEPNWRSAASNYCEAGVCLRDNLDNLIALEWDRMTTSEDALTAAGTNPFVGLTDAEYRRLQSLREDDVEDLLRLLGKVQTSCQAAEFSARLAVPGYDTVIVTFGVPLASDGNRQSFQVTAIDRTYRALPGGSVSAWIRWMSYRFPGIELMEDGMPTAFASYEIGLYIGRLVLSDTEVRIGRPADYGRHPDCAAH